VYVRKFGPTGNLVERMTNKHVMTEVVLPYSTSFAFGVLRRVAELTNNRYIRSFDVSVTLLDILRAHGDDLDGPFLALLVKKDITGRCLPTKAT
jgi:hypothetical protein